MKPELKYDIILFILGLLQVIYAVLCFAILNGVVGSIIIYIACGLIIYDIEGDKNVK